jgi:GDP-D-mannose dehydratase
MIMYVLQVYHRPEELVNLKGDSSKLRSIGFEAEYTFETMLDEMINYWKDFYEL